MASDFSQKGKYEIANQALNVVTEAALRVMLLTTTYVHDKNRSFVDDGTVDDMASRELVATNYTGGFGGAGRKTPASRTLTRDDANARIEFDFADVTWATLGGAVNDTIEGVGLVVQKTTDADSWVVGFDDLTGDVGTNGGDIVFAPNSEGLLQF